MNRMDASNDDALVRDMDENMNQHTDDDMYEHTDGDTHENTDEYMDAGMEAECMQTGRVDTLLSEMEQGLRNHQTHLNKVNRNISSINPRP